MSYYIKGDKNRGAEVIALLESKGGVNGYNFKGDEHDAIFYIDKEGYIKCAQSLTVQVVIVGLCEELTLPEKWTPTYKIGEGIDYISPDGKITSTGKVVGYLYGPKLYIVVSKGESRYWEEKFVTLHKWTPKFKVGDEVTHSVCGGHGVIKGIVDTDNCHHCYIVEDDDDREFLHPWYESETELCKWTPQRGETVLVKAGASCEWEEAVYSYSTENSYHTVGGESWNKIYCIPFDESKLGKVTDD